ncbi:serine/threonine protein kinase [Fusibacter tunisiensis]|uniref:non-specific serine/threonine protein kinase n=1 Tax=Fusibacter tunisiensis TaxID=1008308 RepID=A0ABS2MN98_9FIRM|nr:protein kinase [Fusibacter tunisiensis]MBM7560871.1 serine/threonine protein kinase [Fusibacter tunisiensis]
MEFSQSFEYDIHQSAAGKAIQAVYDLGEEIYRSKESVVTRVERYEDRAVFVLKAMRIRPEIQFELDLVKRLDVQGVNRVVAVFQSDLFLYWVVEYVPGVNLEHYVLSRGKLEEAHAFELLFKISEILERLHRNHSGKFVFRDLKPSNIMVTPEGDVVLIDVVTIREVKVNRTQDTYLIGSKGYTAPEAYGYMQTTERSDVYSTGATLFFMLTGIQPASIEDMVTCLRKDVKLSHKAKRLILKATAFNPKNRFGSVTQLKSELNGKRAKLRKLKAVFGLAGLAFVLIAFTWAWALRPPEGPFLIESGLVIEAFDERSVKITLDESQLPEVFSDYAYMSVATDHAPFYEADIPVLAADAVSSGNGLTSFRSDSAYISGIDSRDCLMLLLYDEDLEVIGYYNTDDIRAGLDFSEGGVELALGYFEMTEGLGFEYYTEYAKLIVDASVYPEAQYACIWSSDGPFGEADFAEIEATFEDKEGFVSLENRVFTGFGPRDYFLNTYWLVYLISESGEIVERVMAYAR